MENCIALIKRFEGFRSHAYLCPAGIATIGYGTTVYPNGMKVQLGDEISREDAERYLKDEITWLGEKVTELIAKDIEMTEDQLGALISFAYNVGIENLKGSTLLRKLNDGFMAENVAAEFARWNKANGEILAGLIIRREEERKLFLGVRDKELQ